MKYQHFNTSRNTVFRQFGPKRGVVPVNICHMSRKVYQQPTINNAIIKKRKLKYILISTKLSPENERKPHRNQHLVVYKMLRAGSTPRQRGDVGVGVPGPRPLHRGLQHPREPGAWARSSACEDFPFSMRLKNRDIRRFVHLNKTVDNVRFSFGPFGSHGCFGQPQRLLRILISCLGSFVSTSIILKD